MAASVSKTTVVITTYNDSIEDLRRALLSVVNQTLSPKEVIVVDDGSDNDVSAIVVEEVGGESKCKIRLQLKENGGPSSARNCGIKNCVTEYIAFLDSDDEMLSGNLEVKEASLESLEESYFGVYGTYIKNPGGEHRYSDVDGIMNVDLIGREKGFPGGVPSYLFRTSKLIEVGGFDEELVHSEDFDLITRLVKKKLKVKGGMGPGFIRNYRPGSISRNELHFDIYRNINRFLDKAERNNYFSTADLARRRAANEANLARKILKEKGLHKDGLRHLKKAFTYAPPKGVKQTIACWLARLLV